MLISSNSFTKIFSLLKNCIIVTLFKKYFDFSRYRRGTQRLCWKKKLILEEKNMCSFFSLFFCFLKLENIYEELFLNVSRNDFIAICFEFFWSKCLWWNWMLDRKPFSNITVKMLLEIFGTDSFVSQYTNVMNFEVWIWVCPWQILFGQSSSDIIQYRCIKIKMTPRL